MAISGYQRYCLNLQGYSGLSDETKRQIDLAQRFKPAVCAAVAVVALVTQSLPVALLGVIRLLARRSAAALPRGVSNPA